MGEDGKGWQDLRRMSKRERTAANKVSYTALLHERHVLLLLA